MLPLYRRGSKRHCMTAGVAAILSTSSGIPTLVHAGETTTPIEHVVVIVGENRSFDHLFATYVARRGETVWNLLSKGIITAEGTPGPHFGPAKQYKGVLKAPSKFSLVPTLPPPNTDGTPSVADDSNPPPFSTLAFATVAAGNSLFPVDVPLLTSGASGLPKGVIDTRILNVNNLPSGPFQLTPGVSYDDYSGSPVHRFYQMWQQFDCSALHATAENPSGCLADLFPWVEVSIGGGNNGKPRPPASTTRRRVKGRPRWGFITSSSATCPISRSWRENMRSATITISL
jgi:phospholipase C